MPTVLKELVGIEAVSKWYMSLHVVTKIFIPFSISLSILFTKDPISVIPLILIAVAYCRISGISLLLLKRYILVIGSMTSFVALTFILFSRKPGNVIFDITLLNIKAEKGIFEWRIFVTDVALSYICLFTLRIFVMIFSAILLLGTLTDRDLVWGLRSIGLPLGFAIAASLFFRGVQFFISDFYTVREAMMARGVDFSRISLIKKFFLYINALIPLLSLMITRSYEVSMALEARGIAPGTKSRSIYHRPKMRRADYALLALNTLILFTYAMGSLC